MKIFTTPEERFENLPGYPFAANYKTVDDGLRMHYLDEGPHSGSVVLLLHGEPSWSYLYRKMIPVLSEAGCRVLVPDLIGFGKSGKPAETSDYSYGRHVKWTQYWFEQMDVSDVTFFGQDWGGLVGLRLVTALPDRFARLFVANTGLPTGDQKMSEAFLRWRAFSQKVDKFPIGPMIQGATATELPDEVIAAYDAPFPDERYKAGARIFPALVPTTPDDPEAQNNREAWRVLMQWEKPLITLFSDGDPITKGGERPFQKLVPGAKGQPHQTIAGGGHFLQEDKGEEIAKIMLAVMER